MTGRDRTTPDRPDPGMTLRYMIMGFRVTQLIYVAAKLGITDHLRLGAQSVDALARATGARPRALYRLLRALASLGIFAETDDRRFYLTHLAESLRIEAPGSLHALARLYPFRPHNRGSQSSGSAVRRGFPPCRLSQVTCKNGSRSTSAGAPWRWHRQRWAGALRYHTACLTGSACSCASCPANSVTIEKSPSRAGVVRAMARRIPLALGLHAQMGAGLLPGDLQAPPEDKPLQRFGQGPPSGPYTARLGARTALRIAHQHPANGQWRHSRVIPHRRGRDELAPPAPRRHTSHAPSPWSSRVAGLAKTWAKVGSRLPFRRGRPFCRGLPWWSGFIQGGIQPQARNATDGMRQPTQPP